MDGRVSGNVVDASGAAVPNADVALYLAGGKKPLLAGKTSPDGSYHFIGVRPAYYDLTVEAQGFVKTTLRNISVDPARETSVPQIKLQLASVSQSVDVTAEAQGVELTNAEVTPTVSMEEIKNLPILDRDPLAVMQTQPGVVFNGNSNTVINGLRTSYSDLTLDGINIQDNYIRDNALDYSPNQPAAEPGATGDPGNDQRQRGHVRRRDGDGIHHTLRHQPASRRMRSGTTATMPSRPTTGSTTRPACRCHF